MVSKLFFLLLFSVGCVSKNCHKQILDLEIAKRVELQSQCDAASEIYDKEINLITEDLRKKNERLAKFNQIDGRGNLRINKWKGDTDNPVTGTEPWQK